jgi:hypothetical protein
MAAPDVEQEVLAGFSLTPLSAARILSRTGRLRVDD